MTAADPGRRARPSDLAAAYVAAARVDVRGRRQAVRAFAGRVRRPRSGGGLGRSADRMAASRAGTGVRLLRRGRRQAGGGRRVRRGVGVEVGSARRRPGSRPGRPVPAASRQSRLRPAGGRQDVVQARPDLCHHRPDPRHDHRGRLPGRPRRVRGGGRRQARRDVAEVAAHPAVRAERGDVPPRPSTAAGAREGRGRPARCPRSAGR